MYSHTCDKHVRTYIKRTLRCKLSRHGRTDMDMYIHIYMYISTCTYMYAYMNACIYIYIYICVVCLFCLYMCIYTDGNAYVYAVHIPTYLQTASVRPPIAHMKRLIRLDHKLPQR